MGMICGCNKWSDNGKLDGMWQILTIENCRTGAVQDVKDAQRYYCLNLHVVNLTYRDKHPLKDFHMTGNMYYNPKLATVMMEFPVRKYNKDDKVETDYEVTEKIVLDSIRPYGIYAITTNFKVEKLSNSHLVLRSDSSLITCRRF